jgi:hypothetical protein
MDTDSIVFTIPDGMIIEFLPEITEISTQFGTYISRVTTSENTITYFREVSMMKGTFPKSAYEDLIKFYRAISNADKCQAILTKKEG